MNINLREEETTAYISFYQSYLDTVQQLNKKVTDVLNDVMTRSKYDKLQRKISAIIDGYTDRIVNDIESGIFPTWEASPGSLRSCLRTYRAGDSADEVCAQIQQHMGDLMRGTLNIQKADWIVTERPVVSEDGLDQLETVCGSAQNEIQDIKAEYLSQLDSKKDDNEIYGTLRPLFEGVAVSMETFFEVSLNEFKELHEFVRGISVQLHNIAEENGVGASGGRGGISASGDRGGVSSSGGGSGNEINSNNIGNHSQLMPGENNTDINFTGENFNNQNRELFVIVIESIVNQVGVNELNSSVNKHYSALVTSRRGYMRSARSASASPREQTITNHVYGRYTVTRKSIQTMAPICAQANSILEPIDKFYKEKFKALGDGFDKANKIIHALSSFMALWGLGTWNLSKLFSKEDSDKTILEKLQLGGLALSACTKAGMIINGGAHLLKILDWAMPYMKKSRTLVKLNEKVWNLTRQDIQIPYVHKRMDQYVMEYYEIKYGMKKGQSLQFEFYHGVTVSIDDDHQRRTFENSIFAAETMLTPQNYIVNESDPQKNRAIYCGIFLNLVRSGMCSKQDIESGKANEIVDKLYDTYVSKENITPRVEISPDKRNVG